MKKINIEGIAFNEEAAKILKGWLFSMNTIDDPCILLDVRDLDKLLSDLIMEWEFLGESGRLFKGMKHHLLTIQYLKSKLTTLYEGAKPVAEEEDIDEK